MSEKIKFNYLSHHGTVEERTVVPEVLEFMANPGYNYQPGWFLRCKDYSRGRNGIPRSFALDRIILEEPKSHQISNYSRLSIKLRGNE